MTEERHADKIESMEKDILITEKNILATIIYYDVMDYPMTPFEIWKHMIRSDYSTAPKTQASYPGLRIVMDILYEKKLAAFLESDSGFYFLKGRKAIVEKRITKQKMSASKIKQLEGVIKWLQYVPFVRMIGVTGALAMNQAHKKSDWDLMIVTKSGKIWTGRTFFTLAAHIIGKRRHGNNISDRVCLNYFVTEDSLEIITKDLFSANEYMFMFPLVGFDIFKRFQVRNIWISSMKPFYRFSALPSCHVAQENKFFLRLKHLGEYMFSSHLIENFFKAVERKRITSNPKTQQEGSLVYAGDDALIFLPDPHGPKIFEKFKYGVSKLGS